jgi:hypothetical protein
MVRVCGMTDDGLTGPKRLDARGGRAMKARQWLLGVFGALTVVSAVLAGPRTAAAAEAKKPASYSGSTIATYTITPAWPK